MRIWPFAALHPTAGSVARVASVAYDVVDRAEARNMARDNADHFLHVTRPDIDFPETEPVGSDRLLSHARDALERLVRHGVLVRDSGPALYLYRQGFASHHQTGIVATVEVADYRRGVIRRHEKTRRDKEADRTRHTLALRAHAGPVFLMYRDEPGVDALTVPFARRDPLLDFRVDDGVRHTVWRLAEDETRALQPAFERVPVAYIADGHHRAAAAGRVADLLARRGTATVGAGRFLAVLFPASQLRILPYNRCVRDLNGMTAAVFLQKVEAVFDLSECGTPPERIPARQAHMYLAGKWYRLSWSDTSAVRDPVSALDVAVLQDRLLGPLLGIGDPREDPRIDFVGGIRGRSALAQRVDRGDHAVAFALSAVTVDQVMDVADAGACMPPKSTWFEPKLRSGLLVHTLDDAWPGREALSDVPA